MAVLPVDYFVLTGLLSALIQELICQADKDESGQNVDAQSSCKATPRLR